MFYFLKNFHFRPVKEKIEGSGGIYTKTNRLFRKSISVRDFRVLCDKMRLPKEGLSPEEVEKFVKFIFISYSNF